MATFEDPFQNCLQNFEKIRLNFDDFLQYMPALMAFEKTALGLPKRHATVLDMVAKIQILWKLYDMICKIRKNEK